MFNEPTFLLPASWSGGWSDGHAGRWWWVVVVAYSILVLAQGPLVLDFWVWGLRAWGQGLTREKLGNDAQNWEDAVRVI